MKRRDIPGVDAWLAVISIVATVTLMALITFEVFRTTAEIEPPASCTCAGRPDDCTTAKFVLDEGRVAHCALWGEDQSCCMVVDLAKRRALQ